MTTSPPRHILLTGFGPFPGMPVNVSAALVDSLARAARVRDPGLIVHTAVLDTHWQRGPAQARAALDDIKPDIVIHFGVSAAAKGFVIETCGVNACRALPDANGHLPPLTVLDPAGLAAHTVTVPVARIVTALHTNRLPAKASSDAGQYLCNAVLYRSLSWVNGQRGTNVDEVQVGFVHIPSVLAQDGPLSPSQALAGGLVIIDTCLGG